jgi:hypothetical protein
MASTRHNIVVSILFFVFGGPGFALVYLPLWITGFRIPSGEPLGQMLLAAASGAMAGCRRLRAGTFPFPSVSK